ncbi:MAG: hypothetical protein MUC62_04115 [Candidatus Thermoplasmatota archaeon]|nr:hypothetical protein [Candidatus Thermoplasmatota archaeon]
MSIVRKYICPALLVLLMVLVPAITSADSDDNGSLASPERIGSGVTWGNVTSRYEGEWPNITSITDDDAYIYALPPLSSVNFTLRKWDLSQNEIFASFYDVDGFRYEQSGTARVQIPGQSDRVTIENELKTAVDIIVLLRGNGTYSMDVRASVLNRAEDDDSGDHELDWIYAETVGDGTYNGSISESKGPPVRYYKVIVPADHLLEITLLKTDDALAVLTLETFTPFREVSYSDIRIKVYTYDQTNKDTYENYDEEVVEKVIRVYGTGNYSMVIDTSKEVEDYSEEMLVFLLVMVLMSFLAVLVPMMIPLTFIVIGVIVIVVMINRSKKSTVPPQDPTMVKEPPISAPLEGPLKPERRKKQTSLIR